MSEHVIDTTDGFLGDGVDLRALFGPRLREEIIRCEKCGEYIENATPHDRAHPHYCMIHGSDMAEPGGFCKWWRRKDE